MTKELNSLSSSVQTRLPSAFDVAVNRDPVELDKYLKNRFDQCEPARWWRTALDCAWKRIWSLNIDDVVEQALEEHPEWNAHRSKSYTWHNPLQEFDGLQIVHLHGWSRVDKSHKMIFSISQYAEATKKEHGWHRRFFDEWGQSPFVTIGAGLFQEFDLTEALQTRPASPNVYSLYVSKTIDPETRELLEFANLIPIESTAEDFFADVEEFTREARKSLRFHWYQQGAPTEIAAAMAEQFELLGIEGSFLNKDHDRDFYAGDDPEWVDIVQDKAAHLSWYKTLTNLVRSSIDANSQIATFLYSKKLGGRTVALLQVSKLLADQGYDVFWFRSSHRPDVKIISDFLATRTRALLVFDGIADFADDVSELMQSCKRRNVGCVILAADLSFKRKAVQNQFDMTLGREFRVPQSKNDSWMLTRSDAEAVVTKIMDVGRFGVIRNLEPDQRVGLFAKREIFDGLSQAEYGAGFRQRVYGVLQKVPNGSVRGLVGLIATLSSQNRGFPLSYASAAGVDSRTLNRELTDGSLGSVLQVRGTFLRTRFRALTPRDLYPSHEQDEFLNTWIEFLASISVYGGRNSRQQRTEAYLVIKTLMRNRTVRSALGKGHLTEFYERLKPYYSDDARFWEQRARAQVTVGNYMQAMSYAAKAAELAPKDSWRLTTYGDICLIRAYQDFPIGSGDFWDLYEAGHEGLRDALNLSQTNALPAILGLKRSMDAYLRYLRSDRPNGTTVLDDLEKDIVLQIRDAYSLGRIGQTIHAEEVRLLEQEFLRWVAAKDAPEHWGDPSFLNSRLLEADDEEGATL
ncbi:P-loop NTPase [Arthrobacter sp. MDT3-44]